MTVCVYMLDILYGLAGTMHRPGHINRRYYCLVRQSRGWRMDWTVRRRVILKWAQKGHARSNVIEMMQCDVIVCERDEMQIFEMRYARCDHPSLLPLLYFIIKGWVGRVMVAVRGRRVSQHESASPQKSLKWHAGIYSTPRKLVHAVAQHLNF